VRHCTAGRILAVLLVVLLLGFGSVDLDADVHGVPEACLDELVEGGRQGGREETRAALFWQTAENV